jgi:hypothetical protein
MRSWQQQFNSQRWDKHPIEGIHQQRSSLPITTLTITMELFIKCFFF